MRSSRQASKLAIKQHEESGVLETQGDELPTNIPDTFKEFFKDFGGIMHDREIVTETGRPKIVKELAPYQYDFATLDYGFMLKCNKVGMTTSEMLCDFWTFLKPQFAGFDGLLQASSDRIANDLLSKLKVVIDNSPKYSQFIDKRNTKVSTLVIKNPWNPRRPSTITAIGQSLSQVYSRMQIKRIHITDPALMTITTAQSDFFAGLFSRILNTGGQIKIEGVPGKSKSGWFWSMSRALFDLEDKLEENKSVAEQFTDEQADFEMPPEITEVFDTRMVTIEDAVKHGIIARTQQEFLEKSLPRQQYLRVCMAQWAESQGALFRGNFQEGNVEAGW